MAFRGPTQSTRAPATPEALYRDLPRKPDAVSGLWTHQGDILRRYTAEHLDTPDLALELPTGTGKTLPGLLLADWVRRARSARVAYACPTTQLARQVAGTAEREGVPAVVLVGPAREWPLPSEAKYDSAGAIGIVTYSTIFNSSPKLSPADLLLFDDAHAGEQYVAEAYSVVVKRRDDEAIYLGLLAQVAPALDGMFLHRLRDETPDPSAHHQVRLVVPLRQPDMVARLDGVLAGLTGPQMYRYSMIRACLPSCLVYVAYGSILVRPLLPPTGDNALFTQARQRIYLSATLGEGGELERSFGRAPIHRLRLPPETPTPRSGRRFFVFPDLVPGADARNLAAKIVALTGKALVLAPAKDAAVQTAVELAAPGWPVLTIDDVIESMRPFAALEHGVCALAARYDGLDLPGDDCRAVVLEGTPDQNNLQERFLASRVRAASALAERIRTRVVQGAGRCTRGPNDWAVVVVSGPSLTKYLLSPDTLNALDPELQAEIQFGLENSTESSVDEVLTNVTTFIEQGDDWRDNGEPLITEFREASEIKASPGAADLSAAVDAEIEAWSYARLGKWLDAARIAQDVARTLGAGGEATRGYRAMWLYLAAMWSDQAATVGDTGAHATSRALLEQASQAARPGTWTREMAPLPDMDVAPHVPADAAAIAAVAAAVEGGVAAGRHDRRVDEMTSALAQRDPSRYEPALTVLGSLLGAHSEKPAGTGRCDSTWCWDNELWIAVEAKSDHDSGGVVPHKDVRQANDQLRLLCSDRHVEIPPPNSATVIVSPKAAVDPTGARGAEAHVHLTSPDDIAQIARDAATAWREIIAGRAGRTGDSLRTLVADALARHSVLASQVLDRLTQSQVNAHP